MCVSPGRSPTPPQSGVRVLSRVTTSMSVSSGYRSIAPLATSLTHSFAEDLHTSRKGIVGQIKNLVSPPSGGCVTVYWQQKERCVCVKDNLYYNVTDSQPFLNYVLIMYC